jgi:hypothetical protein
MSMPVSTAKKTVLQEGEKEKGAKTARTWTFIELVVDIGGTYHSLSFDGGKVTGIKDPNKFCSFVHCIIIMSVSQIHKFSKPCRIARLNFLIGL